jgi:hypothetical protein
VQLCHRVVLVIVGLIGFADSVFTASHNEESAKLGSFKLQTQEQTHHFLPPVVSGGLLGLRTFVIATGAFAKRLHAQQTL